LYLKGCRRHFLSILMRHDDCCSFYAFRYFIRLIRLMDYDLECHIILVKWWGRNMITKVVNILVHDFCKLIQGGKLHPSYIAYLGLCKDANGQLREMIVSWIKKISSMFIQNNRSHILNSSWMLFVLLLSIPSSDESKDLISWMGCIEFFIGYAEEHQDSLNYIMNMTVEIKRCSLECKNTITGNEGVSHKNYISDWTRRLWKVCEITQLVLDQICHKKGWTLSKQDVQLPNSIFKRQENNDPIRFYLPKEFRDKFSKVKSENDSNIQKKKATEYISPRPSRVAKTVAMDSIRSIESIQDQ